MRRTGLTVAVVSSAMLLGWGMVQPLAGTSIDLADPNQPTYRLSVADLHYPYLQRTQDGYIEDQARVGVTLRGAWVATDQYPGIATCEIRVRDDSGHLVGSRELEVGSTGPQTSAIGPVSVDVSGVPVTADAQCAAASLPGDDAGYAFTDLKVIENANGDPVLTGRVTWTTDEPPLLQDCVAALTTVEGASGSYRFQLSVGNGDTLNAILTDGFAGASPTKIGCSPP